MGTSARAFPRGGQQAPAGPAVGVAQSVGGAFDVDLVGGLAVLGDDAEEDLGDIRTKAGSRGKREPRETFGTEIAY